MAKTNKPAVKSKVVASQTVEAPKASKGRRKVLVELTPSRLRDLIGEDTPIGVSSKHLETLVLDKSRKEILASAGL
jgi:hypothetical protein